MTYFNLRAMGIVVVPVVVNLMMVGMILMFPPRGMVIPAPVSHLNLT
jgi:hypothetical protein